MRASDILLTLVKVLFPKVISVSLLAWYGAVVCGRGVCYRVRSSLCPVPPLHRSPMALNKSFLFRGMSYGDLAPLLPWAQGFLLGPQCLWPYPHMGSTPVIWRNHVCFGVFDRVIATCVRASSWTLGRHGPPVTSVPVVFLLPIPHRGGIR